MDYKKLAELLYPNVDKDINAYFQKYYSRNLMNGAVVTRFAPSPTGYLHIGGLFQCVTHQMLTRQQSSVFYLRLEDTDQKREIENAGDLLYETLLKFEIEPTEGYRGNLPEKGKYGLYRNTYSCGTSDYCRRLPNQLLPQQQINSFPPLKSPLQSPHYAAGIIISFPAVLSDQQFSLFSSEQIPAYLNLSQH